MLTLLQGIDTTGWERFGAYAGMIFIFTMFLRYLVPRQDKQAEALGKLTEEVKGLAVALQGLVVALQGRPCLAGGKQP